MTAVGYSDITALSRNGRYRVEAKSPDNRTINQRNGHPPDPTRFAYKYGQEQSDFRYQLIDTCNSSVIWERWQEGHEPSPRELYVSNDGWVVIRTHGYDYARLIAVSLTGRDTLSVGIGSDDPSPETDVDVYLQDEHIHFSTAGLMWTSGAIHYFFRQNEHTYFCFVTGWGRRIIFDLDRKRLVSPALFEPRIEKACLKSEREQAIPSLATAAAELSDYDSLGLFGEADKKDPYWYRWPDLNGHISLVIRNGLSEALPSLKALEARSLPNWSTGCHSLPNRHSVVKFGFRPLLSLAIRHLGEIPAGYACYGFYQRKFEGPGDHDGRLILLPVPECVSHRDEMVQRISQGMNSQQVLELVGSPDYLTAFSERQKKFYEWGENWHYYLGCSSNLATLHLTWKAGSDGAEMTNMEIKEMSHEDVQRRIYEIIEI